MKKLFIGILAAVCCITFTVPAMAQIKVGGMVSAEQFYWKRDKERQAGGVIGAAPGFAAATTPLESYSSVEFAMGQPWNRLNLQYTSEDKKIGAFIELRTGGQKGGGNSASQAAGGALAGANPTGENNFVWETAWINWHFNPNFYLRVGRQTQAFAIYSPDQQMGHNHAHIVMAGFGNIHGGTSRDGIRAYIRFNDNVRMEIQALNPDSDGTTAAPGTLGTFSATLPAVAGTAAREANTIPRFDIAIPIRIANFSIEPSASWAKSEYDLVAPGSDDSYTSWGAALGAKAGFGPFTVTGEVTYGENLNAHTYVGSGNGNPTTYAVGGNTRIADAEQWSAWIQLEFNFGPFAIQGLVGRERAKNEGDPAIANDAAEFKITQMAYGLQFPVMIAKNFKMVPQIWYYDYDDSASIGGAAGTARRAGAETDRGSEWTIGVFWQLTF